MINFYNRLFRKHILTLWIVVLSAIVLHSTTCAKPPISITVGRLYEHLKNCSGERQETPTFLPYSLRSNPNISLIASVYIDTSSLFIAGLINLNPHENNIDNEKQSGDYLHIYITEPPICDTAVYIYNYQTSTVLILYKDSPCLSTDSLNYTTALMVFDSSMTLHENLVFAPDITTSSQKNDESSEFTTYLYRWLPEKVESTRLHRPSKFLLHYTVADLYSMIETIHNSQTDSLFLWEKSGVCSNSIIKRLCKQCQ